MNGVMNIHHNEYFDMNYRVSTGYQGFMIHSHVGSWHLTGLQPPVPSLSLILCDFKSQSLKS